MMDLATIKSMADEQANEARREGKRPVVLGRNPSVESVRKIPNIGSYRPAEWILMKEHFVDSSGLGEEGELALSFNQFMKKIKPNRGYAIIEAGEFQVYIGEFRRKTKR